jgi:hypothetical protein
VEVFDPASTRDSEFESWCESESYITTYGQSASLSWNKAPIWRLRPDLYYFLTVAGLLICGALSNERTGQENVDLYIHSPIRLLGVVLN